MERLEKALNKAKDPSRKSAKSFTYSADDSISIDYTQTKIHSTDQEVLKDRRVVALEKYGIEAETFRLLRTKILKQLRDNNWTSFGVTAPSQGAGKSMVSVNLAIAMAKEVNQTVLLVDLDLKNPKIDWYFDINVKKGLSDYLDTDTSLSEILINPSIERLVILPGKGRAIESSELLTGPKMRKLVQEIKRRYKSRIVIFDLPPVLASDDVLASMDFFDAILLVVAEGENKPEDIKKSLKMLSGSNLLGTVLNKAAKVPEHLGYY